jgi:hypothetical protein
MNYLDILNLIGAVVGKLLSLDRDRKIAVAKYLETIADTLTQFPSEVLNGEPRFMLAQRVGEVSSYASQFEDATAGVLDESQRYKFKQLLSTAKSLKTDFVDAAGNPVNDEDRKLCVISEIAGTFRATAARLRAAAI